MPTPLPIQKLRLQRGWSQQQLADLSGLSTRTIQRLEKGQTASTESLKSLASVFEIDFSQLTPETHMEQHHVSPEEQLALLHAQKLRQFYLHVLKYVLVIGALAIFNWIKHPDKLWVIWPALGWGLGLVFHAVRVFELLPFMQPTWERKQVEKKLGHKL